MLSHCSDRLLYSDPRTIWFSLHNSHNSIRLLVTIRMSGGRAGGRAGGKAGEGGGKEGGGESALSLLAAYLTLKKKRMQDRHSAAG